MRHRSCFLPLLTYPDPLEDAAVGAALRMAKALGARVCATAYRVDVPQVSTPLGGMLLDLSALAHAAEARSAAEADRVAASVKGMVEGDAAGAVSIHRVILGAVNDAAIEAARLHDVAVMPWIGDAAATRDLAEALVFGAGRPVIVVPADFEAGAIDHVAIAWDGSRVAARALGDALALLSDGGRVSVLTVGDEKPIAGADPAGTLAAALTARGIPATARAVALGEKSIAAALQDAARDEGARLMAMGGFGHSRLRDFVLGGATTGILADLRIATLLSH
jgi:nucleotide-binding universal stress UspA family protein